MDSGSGVSLVHRTTQFALERQLAPLLEKLLLFTAAAVVTLLAANLLAGAVALDTRLLLPNGILVLIILGGALLARRRHVNASLWLIIMIVMLAQSYNVLSYPLWESDRTLVNFVIPVALAGLFLGRWPLLAVTLASVGIVWAAALTPNAGVVGDLPPVSTAIQFTIIAIIFAVLIDMFRLMFYRALETAMRQAQALERFQVENVDLYASAEAERERLQVTLASIGDAVITTDTEARITFMNAVASAMSGRTAEDAIGKPLTEVFKLADEETGAPIDNPVERVLLEGLTGGLANHTVLIRPNGTRTPIADSGAPIRSPQGRIQGAVLVFRDVSEDRKAQIALQESESRFRTLADSTPALIWMSNASGGCIYFNKVWYDFTGRTYKQEYGYGWTEGIHPDDHEAFLHTYNTSFAARKPFTIDLRMCRHDGTYRWLVDNGVPRFGPDGTFLGFIGSCVDITDRRKHESRTRLLQNITARFSEALTQQQVAEVVMEQVMSLLGGHLGTLYALKDDGQNLELLSMKGGQPDVIIRYRLLPLDSPGPVTDAFHSRKPVWVQNFDEYETRYPQFSRIARDNGSQSIISVPLIVDDRLIGAFSMSFRQVMEFDGDLQTFIMAIAQQCAQALDRARLYEIETDARRQAEAANMLKLQFLAMISHELRTPLTSIKGFTSTLLASDVSWEPETQREFLGILDVEADRLTELVEQLLDVSRLQAGNLSIAQSLQPFETILSDVDPALNLLTQGFKFTRDIASDLPPIYADGRRVAQVLTNLIANAAKYAPSGSEIALRADVEDDVLRVAVSDTGPGIPEDEREAVFGAFHQLQHQRSGAGLGLAICKGLVEAHGGQIWIDGRDTPGTTVVFTLPLRQPVEHARSEAAF